MTEVTRDPGSELPLSSAVLHILLSLVDEERHGYGIMQEVAARTEGQVHLAPGTLYGAIKRLLAKGLIEESGEHSDPKTGDERRHTYRLTEFGQRVLAAEAARLAGLVQQVRDKRLLSHLLPNVSTGGALCVMNGRC